jgi:hypothetical protein
MPKLNGTDQRSTEEKVAELEAMESQPTSDVFLFYRELSKIKKSS